jgi:hypothetical protein
LYNRIRGIERVKTVLYVSYIKGCIEKSHVRYSEHKTPLYVRYSEHVVYKYAKKVRKIEKCGIIGVESYVIERDKVKFM